MGKLSNFIIAYALKNAIEFGKVDAGRVLPKLFQHGLDKKDIKEIMVEVNETVKNINSMGVEERKLMFESFSQFVKEKEEEGEEEDD